MKNYLQKNQIFFIACFLWLFIFASYLKTLAPTVGFIDSGELSTVALSLGIAHPTGYPLFTLLSRIFSLVPTHSEVIVRLNIFSALLTATASVFFFFFIIELFGQFKKAKHSTSVIAAIFATSVLAFSKTFWTQAVSIEVYSLHLLLICIFFFLFAKGINTGEKKIWVLFSFVVGLSFTNHLTTILLAPALLYWFFNEYGISKKAFTKIAFLIPPFIAGLSVYLYLPIRALQNPLLNWGNPQTFEKFWWHFSGKQFRVWMFSSSESAQRQVDYFFNNLPNEFHFIILSLAVIGFFILLFSNRRIFLFAALLFSTCVLYAINYDIHDIDSYFLLAFISIAIFVGVGVQKILENFESKSNSKIVAICLVILSIIQIMANYEKVDQSKNYLVEDYTKNILRNLPKNSIVLSYQWDYFVSSSYYFQQIKNIRRDVIVFDKELFRRSWYVVQLEKMYPSVMTKSKNEIDRFQQELYKFEHELPYDFSEIEGSYSALLKSFIEKNDSVAFYVTPEIEMQYTNGYNRIPEGLLFRLTKDAGYMPVSFPDINFRNFLSKDLYCQQIKKLTVEGLLRREVYERDFHRDSLANLYHQKALEISNLANSQVSNF